MLETPQEPTQEPAQEPAQETTREATERNSPQGEYHLLGPPGAGKSTALARSWIPRAIARWGADAVAVCSLTRTAAQEIASRGTALPRERVSTLHAMALAALRDVMGAPGLAQTPQALKRWNDEVAKGDPRLVLSTGGPENANSGDADDLAGAVGARGSSRDIAGVLSGDAALATIEVYRHTRTPEDLWLDRRVFHFWRAWYSWKTQESLYDFTDLIDEAIESGAEPPKVRGTPVRCLIVDEAQDLSPLEHALVRFWETRVEMCVLAGDPNQSIYTFRGADPLAFHNPATFPEDRTYPLRKSFRLPGQILAYAEKFLLRTPSAIPIKYEPRDGNTVSPQISHRPDVTMSHTSELCEIVKAELALLDRAGCTGNDARVMLLASAGFLLTHAIRALRTEGVRYHNPFRAAMGAWNPLRGAHTHVLALFAPFRADIGGADPDATGCEPDGTDGAPEGGGGEQPAAGGDGPEQTPTPSAGAGTIEGKASTGDGDRYWTWQELERWTSVCAVEGLLVRGAKTHVIAERVRRSPDERMSRGDLGRVFVDVPAVLSLVELLKSDKHQDERACLAWYKSVMTSAHGKRLGYAITVANQGLDMLIKEPRVIIGTIHSVKGGTAGSVILAPDYSHAAQRSITEDSRNADPLIRTFYVGLTRPSQRLVLLGPAMANAYSANPHVEW